MQQIENKRNSVNQSILLYWLAWYVKLLSRGLCMILVSGAGWQLTPKWPVLLSGDAVNSTWWTDLLGSSSPVFLFQQVSSAHERLWAVELIFYPFYGTSAVVNKSCPSRGSRWLFRLNAICYTANGYWMGLFTKSLLIFQERVISFLYERSHLDDY